MYVCNSVFRAESWKQIHFGDIRSTILQLSVGFEDTSYDVNIPLVLLGVARTWYAITQNHDCFARERKG